MLEEELIAWLDQKKTGLVVNEGRINCEFLKLLSYLAFETSLLEWSIDPKIKLINKCHTVGKLLR